MNTNVRRKSTPLDVARSRCEGLASQDPQMDLGNGLSIQSYQSSITALEAQLLKVINKVSELQTERALLRDMETQMRDLNDRYMKATAAKFGTSSYEYMAIGGVRKIDRKRPTSAVAPPPDSNSGD